MVPGDQIAVPVQIADGGQSEFRASGTVHGLEDLPALVGKGIEVDDRCARFCAHLGRGTMLEATGRLQSREYVKVLDGVQETRTAYELSIGKLTVL